MAAAVGRLWRLAALAALLAVGGAQTANESENVYIDARDVEVADLVASTVDEACAVAADSGGDGTDVAAAREDLLAALGGENLILNILKEAESQDDLTSKVEEQVQVPWLISIAAPIAMSFVVLLFYLACCWSCCPCCRCCRCCAKERKTSLLAKIILAVMLVVCLVGILVGGVQTLAGVDSCRSGFDDMACSSSKVLQTTLSGQSNPYFIGMMPVLETIWTLDQQLEDNSPMLSELDTILDKTSSIEDAVTVASRTIELLSDMMALSSNVNPVVGGEDLMHDCEFCTQLAPPLQEAAGLMQGGVATALAEARSEVKSVLSPEARTDLQETLRSSTDPLIAFKESVRDTFGGFVEPGQLDSLRGIIDNYLKPILFVFFFLALLLFSFACLAANCFVFREKTSESTYNRHTHRLAGCVWCSAVFLVFPVLLIGGLMSAVSVPLAGVCLTMADLNGQMLRDIGPAFGMDMTGDLGVMLSGIIDQCISPTDASLNANLMDIIFTRNATTNEEVYVREQIVSTVQAPLDQAFAGIDAAMAGSSISLSNSTELLSLRSLIANNPVDAMFLPDEQKIRAKTTLQPMLVEPDLTIALATSTRCSNFSMVGDMGSFPSQVIPGLATFGDRLKAYGTEIAGSTCLAKVICTGQNDAACEAGNAFVELKRKMMDPLPSESPVFRCDLFKDANGLACDPITMTQDAAGQWQNDCLVGEGSNKGMQVLERPCSLSEFVVYVQGFDQRIERTLARLDSTTAEVMTGITTDLAGLVNTHVLSPVLDIVAGINCGFMPAVYREVVDGLCYQGVVGFRRIGQSYVFVAVSVLLLALVMHVLWRRAIDNVNAEADGRQKEPEQAGQDAAAPPIQGQV